MKSAASQEFDTFAIAPPGLERLVAAEVAALGITAAVVPGGVEWTGSLAQVRRANLQLRIATRVLVRTAHFRARTFFELERHATKIDWRRYLSTAQRFRLRTTSKKSKLYHEGAINERLERMIREQTGAIAERAADADDHETDAQLFIIRVVRDQFMISADTSGAPLHFRGYRQALAKAPLRETLAAALLRLGGWDGSRSLLDPMCGSGVIPIEAALIARNIPPGLARAERQPRCFAFESWPLHDRRAWSTEVQHARARVRTTPAAVIYGSDRDAGAIEAARANAARAGVEHDIEFTRAPLSAARLPPPPLLVASNPPYGIRVSEAADLRNLYAAFGRLLRETRDARIAILAADEKLVGHTGLPLRSAAATRTGGIDVKVFVAG